MLVALGTIAAQQPNGTEEATADEIVQLLKNYCATHPVSTIRYQASDMILRIHSDAPHKQKHKVDQEEIFISATNLPTTQLSTMELSS
jgi:hypothetical protein